MTRSPGFREDLQGLRAIAVLLVLFYHLWPRRVPGGYVGVDVFFVISGFLMTTLLVGEASESGTISIGRFYARRARRLLPASLVTLAAVLLGTLLVMPQTIWRDTAEGVTASALYVANWWLAGQAVDYLAVDSSPSLIQHFWSLSVEEQFYLAWPLVLLVVHRALRGRVRLALGGVLALVLVTSFSLSVASNGDPAAYFSTWTRAWQLVAGALLVLLPRPVHRGQVIGVIAGLGAIAASAVLFSGRTQYPGVAAALPTLGAALVIYTGRSYLASPLTSWLGARPIQVVGDISYSLYLWHWPVILFAAQLTGGELTTGGGLLALAASFVLGGLSKRFVEDPFRHRGPRPRPWRVLAAGAVATAACVGLALSLHHAGRPSALRWFEPPGASVMLRGGPLPTPATAHVPPLLAVEDDVAAAYSTDCIQGVSGSEIRTCEYGPDDAAVRIAVVGDSHAVHWFPAFQVLVDQLDLQVVGVTKTTCAFSTIEVHHDGLRRGYRECLEWTHNVIEYLRSHRFDHVILSQSPHHVVAGMEDASAKRNVHQLAKGVQEALAHAAASGARLAVIRPTPWQPTRVRDCAASSAPPYDDCTGTQKKTVIDDAVTRAAAVGGYTVLDFTDLFCRDGLCPAVIGDVFVYRDRHHVTATYMRTLAPMVRDRLGLVR